MKLNFLFVCDSAEAEKKLNVSGIFDSINAKSFPAIHSALTIVANVEAIDEEERNKSYVESFKILYGDKVIMENEQVFETKTSRSQFIHNIRNLPLERAGRYDIQIFVGSKKIGETYFIANKI